MRKSEPLPKAEPVDLGLKAEHIAVVRRAMVGVTQQGTSTRVFQGAAYLSGGKTGTAQAVGVAQGAKYNASKLEEHQRDHSLYIAFAPADAGTWRVNRIRATDFMGNVRTLTTAEMALAGYPTQLVVTAP